MVESAVTWLTDTIFELGPSLALIAAGYVLSWRGGGRAVAAPEEPC